MWFSLTFFNCHDSLTYPLHSCEWSVGLHSNNFHSLWSFTSCLTSFQFVQLRSFCSALTDLLHVIAFSCLLGFLPPSSSLLILRNFIRFNKIRVHVEQSRRIHNGCIYVMMSSLWQFPENIPTHPKEGCWKFQRGGKV